MKRISLPALLILIAATAPPAAAGTTVPVCPPQWLAELLRGYHIASACTVEDRDVPSNEGIVRQPRSVAVDLPTDIVPIRFQNAVVPEPRGDGGKAFLEHSTDGRGLSATRPARRTKQTSEAP
jgi:hypothetical protein